MSRREFLSNLVALSEAMLDHGRRGEWEDVERIEAARRGGLEAFFADSPAADEANFIRESLERMLILDRELGGLAARARDEAGTRLGEMRTARRAQAAYGSLG